MQEVDGGGWGGATSQEAALFFIYKLLVTANKETYTPLCRKTCIPRQMRAETFGPYGDSVRPLHRNRRGPLSDAGDELQQILQSM